MTEEEKKIYNQAIEDAAETYNSVYMSGEGGIHDKILGLKKDFIEPCPFCLGEAELTEFRKVFQIMCSKCHCSTAGYDDKGRAIEVWSTRA